MIINRRSLLVGGGALALTGLVAGCAPAAAPGSGQTAQSSTRAAPDPSKVTGALRVYVGGDTNVRDLWQKVIIPAFVAKYAGTTLTVQHDLHSEQSQQTLAKLSAAATQNQDPGIDFIDDGLALNAAKASLLEPVGNSNVPELAGVPVDVLNKGLGQAFPYRASSVLLAYNPATVNPVPKTLNEVLDWITAHPGRFAYNSPSTGGSGQAFVVSMLDLNLPPGVRDKMNAGYDKSLESGWDAGFAKLVELGPSMYQKGVYPNGNSQVLDLLSSGQIDMAPVWSDMFISGQANKTIPATIKAKQIANPSFTGGASYLGIPKAGKNPDAALALASFILSPELQGRIAKEMAGYPVIGLDKMPEDIRNRFADADPSNLRLGYSSDYNEDLNKLWDQKVPTRR